MREKKMNQRCKDDRVPGTGDWENYMWPHNLDISGAQHGEQSSKVDELAAQLAELQKKLSRKFSENRVSIKG